MPSPLPSRRLMFRAERYVQRLAIIEAVLDAIPDRSLPLPRDVAGRFRRTLDEGRALFGLGPSERIKTSLQPADFFVEMVTIFHLLAGLKAPEMLGTPDFPTKSNPRDSAPW